MESLRSRPTKRVADPSSLSTTLFIPSTRCCSRLCTRYRAAHTNERKRTNEQTHSLVPLSLYRMTKDLTSILLKAVFAQHQSVATGYAPVLTRSAEGVRGRVHTSPTQAQINMETVISLLDKALLLLMAHSLPVIVVHQFFAQVRVWQTCSLSLSLAVCLPVCLSNPSRLPLAVCAQTQVPLFHLCTSVQSGHSKQALLHATVGLPGTLCHGNRRC